MELETTTGQGKWVPKSKPLFEKITNIAKYIRRRFAKRPRAFTTDQREIEPNYLFENIPRYNLYNCRKYCGNKISTTKYPSLLLFIPMNFLYQIKNYANVYFLLVATINAIPYFESYSGWKSFLPIGIIMIFSAIKEFYEDYKRQKSDKKVNETLVHVWDVAQRRFRKMEWQHLLVGDFVHLSINETIPADILLIRSSDTMGMVFVETSNLDGESNLKERSVLNSCLYYCGENEKVFNPLDFNVSIFASPPNKDLKRVTGKIKYSSQNIDLITKENIIYRGCELKNTTFIEGIVLYTGQDTKTMLNSGCVRIKRSSLDSTSNKYTLICILVLFIICIFETILAMVFYEDYSQKNQSDLVVPWVDTLEDRKFVIHVFKTFMEYILSFQILVPLSLYISAEFIKFFQSIMMKFDLDMYHEESDTAMASNALNIPEELGLIKYVLSDKTGTLTENKMVFRGCHIAGEDFSDDCEPFTTHIYEDPEVYTSKSLKERLTKEVLDESSQIYHFFMNLAICNTVVVNKKREDTIDRGFKEGDTLRVCNSSFYSPQNEDEIATDDGNESDRTNLEQLNSSSTEDNDNESVSSLSDRIRTSVRSFSNKVSSNLKSSQKRIITAFNRKSDQSKLLDRKVSNKDNFYEGESPDELSLVKAAKAYGFEMKKRFPSHINITINRLGPMSMNVTKVLRFDSIRKRMSVVSMQNGKIYLYSKGSDDSIFNSLCSSFSNTEEGTIKIKLAKQAVQNFAEDGKRTLVFGYKILSFEELEAFNDILDKIETSDPDDKDDQLTSVFDSMEKKLILLGVVSIEDRLQDGVSETIIALRRAGVKVWVLTGDKYETALNIAKGCSLFLHDSTILKIDKEEDMDRVPIRVSSYNVVLSSDGIKLLRANDEKLINLLKHASSVLCYRMTPGEKADISNMVKKHFKAHVLAIGDGANDVPMIQSADIGVGIGGQEGRQAVMSADFSFARFKFLQKLLLVHGHWNYYRITEALLLLFYKNFMYCLILFWYNFYNGFSAMCPYDQNYGMLYPIIFSGLQPIIYGIFDQDYSAKELLNNPEKYKITQQNSNYSIRLFLLNVVDAIWQSLAIYFIAYFAYKDTDVDMWTFGYCLITSIFFVNSFHMALLIKSWNVIQTVVNVFFFFVHFLFFFVYTMTANAKAGIPDTPVYTAPNTTFTFIFWAVIFLTTSVSLMPRFYIKILTKRYPILLLQEDDKLRIKTFFKKKFT